MVHDFLLLCPLILTQRYSKLTLLRYIICSWPRIIEWNRNEKKKKNNKKTKLIPRWPFDSVLLFRFAHQKQHMLAISFVPLAHPTVESPFNVHCRAWSSSMCSPVPKLNCRNILIEIVFEFDFSLSWFLHSFHFIVHHLIFAYEKWTFKTTAMNVVRSSNRLHNILFTNERRKCVEKQNQ